MSIVYSIQEQMMQTIFAKFEALTGCAVFRTREASLALPEGIAIIIKPREEAVTYLANNAAKRDFVLSTEILARGGIPEQSADPVRVAMHAALMSDPTLGGLSLRIVEESTEWSFEEADQTAASIVGRYRIIYLTPAATLTQAA